MKRYLFISIISLLFTSCGGDSVQSEGDIKPVVAKQTLIFYIQSNNNLYAQLWKDVDEIAACQRSNDGNNVLIFIDSQAGTNVVKDEDGNWISKQTTPKNQLFIADGGKLKPVDGFEERFAGQKSSDMTTFKSILTFCVEKFPAEKYGLTLGSHGTGWAPVSTKSIGGNDFTDEYMEIIDISKSLPLKFEYIILDACIMSNMTTLYQLKNCADYIVASSMNTPAGSFDYKVVLNDFLNGDLVGACEKYIEKYRSAKFPAVITVTNTKYLGEVAAFNKRMFAKYEHLVTSREQLETIQKCELDWRYVDYADFIDTYLGKNSIEADNVRKMLDKICVYKGWSGFQYREFEITSERYSGYAHWINGTYFGESYLSAHKAYSWYSDAGLDMYMPDILKMY